MPAKKRPKKGSKDAARPEPATQPVSIPEPPDNSGTAPADIPAEGRPGQSGPPVAGIGASAGGLEAFKKFFAAMPADSGVAFVLVPHLDPAHESLMVELLARHTTMPVVEAANNMPVEANRVYIIPPNKYMTIHRGILRLTGPVERRASQTSIDLFLRSLADDQQERAICIILSGTGSHGTPGLKAIKAAGGLTMVQDPTTAEYERMPQSAIATGLADYILPAEQMPEALVKYVRHAYVNGGVLRIEVAPEAADQLTQVLALLRTRAKFDFRCYRKKMLTRRVERRMGLNHFDSIPEYVAFLRDHPQELKQLVKDLFISVTSFFRDPDAFGQLTSEVIIPLVESIDPDEVIRVWVPGCATGEEPYSIAMLLLEQLATAHKSCKVQIFATDVDEEALDVARQGLYAESIAADVSPERLARYFTRVDEHNYQVNKQLRETVVIAPQNIINDAPFTKLDLISCRNLLIYLEPDVQKKVIGLLHFALKQGGALFLGPSETIGRHVDLFEPKSKKWRIYRRIGPTRPERVDFPIVAKGDTRGTGRRQAAGPDGTPTIDFAVVSQGLLLELFAPAAVLINRKYEILHYFGPCTHYLEFPAGAPTQDLILMAREGLRSKLRGAVHRAIRENDSAVLEDVQVKRNGNYFPARVTVNPVRSPHAAEGLLLITFEEQKAAAAPTVPSARVAEGEARAESTLRQLENELKATREDLQSTIEEMESSNEELKASNEEVMSMNEELQSANEELETSKEELQSLNEELTTVNNQLQEKVGELEGTNNDMANLLNCTDIATIFLDEDLRIKRFTPAANKLFNLIATDVNRPISDITPRFADTGLLVDVQQVLQQLVPREKEITTSNGDSWFRRILPYRTRDNSIDGVVLTFSDLTILRRADAAVRKLDLQLAAEAAALTRLNLASSRLWRIQNLHEGLDEMLVATIELLGADKGNVQLLDAARGVLVMAAHRGFDQPFLDFFREVSTRDNSACGQSLRSGQRTVIADVEADELYARLRPIARTAGYRAVQSTPLIGRHGAPLGMISTHFRSPHRPNDQDLRRLDVYARQAADFIERCHLNESLEQQVAERTHQLHEREERLQAILNTAMIAIVNIDPEGTMRAVNPATERLFGYTADQMIGRKVTMLVPTPAGEESDGSLARFLQTDDKHMIGGREVEGRRQDGSVFPLELEVSEVQPQRLFTAMLRDITHRKALEREVVEIASLEQRRIGGDLHDSVGQELTALNILAGELAEMLPKDLAKEHEVVERVVRGLRQSQTQLRSLLRGLLPVDVDSQGLMSSLTDLAAYTTRDEKRSCTFDCPAPVAVADNLVATHLYLIAQEAVHNAIKHARAKTIKITLRIDGDLVLSVQDDGVGMTAETDHSQGLGLRIMRNRAAIIAAKLSVETAKPSGTLVTCVLAGNKK